MKCVLKHIFLASTGKRESSEMLKIVDVDSSMPSFWNKAYKIIGDMIKRYVKSIKM